MEGYISILMIVAIFGLLVWNRYLHHKETLQMLEHGGESQQVLDARERSRHRTGVISGVVLLTLGFGIAHGVNTAEQAAAIEAGTAATLGGLSLFLILLGVVTLGLHAVWGRQMAGRTGRRDVQTRSREDTQG